MTAFTLDEAIHIAALCTLESRKELAGEHVGEEKKDSGDEVHNTSENNENSLGCSICQDDTNHNVMNFCSATR